MSIMDQKSQILISIIMTGAVFLNAPVLAQELGSARRGSELVLGSCVGCHAVRKSEESINPLAPSFTTIAEVKGMSATALNVTLSSPHRTMPNIMLETQERADVIAYILGLNTD
jgi:mono/diheme cytochrome c family protein